MGEKITPSVVKDSNVLELLLPLPQAVIGWQQISDSKFPIAFVRV